MKVLVAGAQGQVARALMEAAPPPGATVIAMGRPDLDLTRHDTLRRALDACTPDYVVNAAAYTAVDRAEDEIDLAMDVNCHGAGRLAELCRDRAIPIIHLSTDYVYDGRNPDAYLETDTPHPLGVYGQSKRAGEEAVMAAQPRHIVLRTAWVHSPVGHNFVRTMLRLGLSGQTLKVVDDQWGNPTYAAHLAVCILDLIGELNTSGSRDRWGIYHAAGCGTTSRHAFAQEIFAQAARHGRKPPIVEKIATADYPTAAARPANACLDCSKLQVAFGLRLPDWQDGVRACVDRLVARQTEQLGVER